MNLIFFVKTFPFRKTGKKGAMATSIAINMQNMTRAHIPELWHVLQQMQRVCFMGLFFFFFSAKMIFICAVSVLCSDYVGFTMPMK